MYTPIIMLEDPVLVFVVKKEAAAVGARARALVADFLEHTGVVLVPMQYQVVVVVEVLMVSPSDGDGR